MKKTISINLSGIVFYIEEDGYDLLQKYLTNIKEQFSDNEEANMVLEDVEIRIAELFSLRLNEFRTAISEQDVKEVMEQMGEASSYAPDEEDIDNSNTYSKNKSENAKKKLFRDPENGSFGGVAAGLAAYFNIEVSIIRVIFVVLTIIGTSGLLIYVLLWIFLPKVNSTSDRLKMFGRPITVENISKEINDASQRFGKKSEAFTKEFIEKTEPRFKKLGNILSKLIGTTILIASIFWLTTFLLFTVGQIGIIGENAEKELLSLFNLSGLVLKDGATYYLGWTGIFIGIITPLIGFILLGLTLIFKFNTTTTKKSYFTLFIFWTVALILCISVGFKTGFDMIEDEKLETEITKFESEKITLNWENFKSNNRNEEMKREEIVKVKNDSIYLPIEKITIFPSQDSLVHVYVRKRAHGSSSNSALARIEKINALISVSDNTINIPAYFSFPKKDLIRNQSLNIIIEIPQNTSVERKVNHTQMNYSLDGPDDYIKLRKTEYYENYYHNRID